MLSWAHTTESVALGLLGEQYARYRLCSVRAERAMRGSLERYGQLSPLVAARGDEHLEIIDGFKRATAARQLQWSHLDVRLVHADGQQLKAAIYWLNRSTSGTQEIEEAWIIHALVREDGLSQAQVAELMGRHKSWVCRRLALVERLCPEAVEDLRLGLLRPTMARELARLPAGNQSELVALIQREQLTRDELRVLVDGVLGCSTEKQRCFILEHPREVLAQNRATDMPRRDPRLSPAGQKAARRLGTLDGMLAGTQSWLSTRARGELNERDLSVIAPYLHRVASGCEAVAELARDVAQTARVLG
jgi:ParB-like chromosome segregation protein Spo0J